MEIGSFDDGTYCVKADLTYLCFVYLTNNSLFRKVYILSICLFKDHYNKGFLLIIPSLFCKCIKKKGCEKECI